jgi:hypothetical protein
MKLLFCHNVHLRYKTLYDTIRIEKKLFPDSECIVAYNNEMPPREFDEFDGITFTPYNGLTHKIGCANGCITSIQEALESNPDVIVFSHDDVFISEKHLEIFNDRIKMIVDGKSDFICRLPSTKELTFPYGENYYMMECFFISGKAAKQTFGNLKLYNNEEEITRDVRGSISPEAMLYEVTKNIERKHVIIYDHKLEGYNETLESLMGHHHLNAGIRGWI